MCALTARICASVHRLPRSLPAVLPGQPRRQKIRQCHAGKPTPRRARPAGDHDGNSRGVFRSRRQSGQLEPALPLAFHSPMQEPWKQQLQC